MEKFKTRAMTGFAGGGNLLKPFSALALACFVVSPAVAGEIDLSGKPIGTPTLDYLKENDILIPQKGVWDSAANSWAEGEPIVSPGSEYTLVRVAEPGDNTITKFEWDAGANDLVPVYYRVENYVEKESIYNGYNNVIENITGDFVGNDNWFKIENRNIIGNITGDFIDNKNEFRIDNRNIIGNITGDFIDNIAYYYGVINNDDGSSVIGNIAGDFIGNKINNRGASAGIITNWGNIGDITANFISNTVQGSYLSYYSAGAIFNSGSIGRVDSMNNSGGIINSNFINNSVEGGDSLGAGAIFTRYELNIIADNGTSTFKGNYVKLDGAEKDDVAIVLDSSRSTPTLNLISRNNGEIYMYDKIKGNSVFNRTVTVNITGDNTGKLALYNDIQNANVILSNTTLDTINNNIHEYNFNNFVLTDNAQMTVDVDLANNRMDRITADGYDRYDYESNSLVGHQGILTVTGMNLLSDAKSDHTEIYFAEKGLKDNVESGISETGSTYQTTAYTPIYKYGVSYDNREDGGYFLFDRAGAYSSNPSDSFNPAVLDSSVSAQAGTQSALNETVRFAFQHMDMFSQMPSFQRMAIINQNKYAIKDVAPKYNSDFETLDKGYWVKPFTSFESINLHHGPSVDAITYGTLVGFDGNFRELKHDWYNVQSIYAGYIGSQMSYTGVDTSLNGGVLGLTETFYKGNFFGALTATAGASLADSSTMYGNEDFTSLLGGVGAKTGYNFEFKNGKYILQPIMFMNYSFVNTFDYTNAAKVKIKSDPLLTFQINPQLKFIANLDKGWQPYASVGFVWNVLNSSKVRANDVVLPRMSVDPYVEYGLGVQRNWKDRFTGFAQAMVRNGGRNGVALTFGFRWALGKEAEDL